MRTITLAERLFDGPQPIGTWTPLARAGVYCVIVAERVVYVGQSSNFAEQAFPDARQGGAGWLAIADCGSDVYIAACWMPRSSEEEREALRRELIGLYHPECNQLVPAPSLLTH